MQGKNSKPRRYVLNLATILSLLDKPSHLLLPKKPYLLRCHFKNLLKYILQTTKNNLV